VTIFDGACKLVGVLGVLGIGLEHDGRDDASPRNFGAWIGVGKVRRDVVPLRDGRPGPTIGANLSFPVDSFDAPNGAPSIMMWAGIDGIGVALGVEVPTGRHAVSLSLSFG